MTAIFPELPGLAIGIKRSAKWLNRNSQAVSGKETNVAMWSYPEWWWSLPFEALQTIADSPDFAALASFYNGRGGDHEWFLYRDPDDCAVTGQPLGLGDGVTTTFQLVRAMGGLGGFVEPIWAPDRVTAVSVGGVALAPAAWSVVAWGNPSPGTLTLAAPPAVGAEITADFSFYFVARFTEIAAGIWSADKVAFKSRK